ncbi:hypothetical protein [Hymenobacter rigui]|uniref:Uncharacterized protein n=1 Tax=Hymenobacter rigui TaxID=334424 RepID=A0A3R9PE00_9BACT|nr:hypothetical protein [Hymenobacter rigui]RSK50088.1 hypothetical protein EI291_05405 [Hymenobacter rigui]
MTKEATIEFLQEAGFQLPESHIVVDELDRLLPNAEQSFADRLAVSLQTLRSCTSAVQRVAYFYSIGVKSGTVIRGLSLLIWAK